MTELPLFEAESTYSHRPCNLFTTKHNEIDTVVASSTRRAALNLLLLLPRRLERSIVMRKCTFRSLSCLACSLCAVPARKPCTIKEQKKSLFSYVKLHFPAQQREEDSVPCSTLFCGLHSSFYCSAYGCVHCETEMQFAQKIMFMSKQITMEASTGGVESLLIKPCTDRRFTNRIALAEAF